MFTLAMPEPVTKSGAPNLGLGGHIKLQKVEGHVTAIDELKAGTFDLCYSPFDFSDSDDPVIAQEHRKHLTCFRSNL